MHYTQLLPHCIIYYKFFRQRNLLAALRASALRPARLLICQQEGCAYRGCLGRGEADSAPSRLEGFGRLAVEARGLAAVLFGGADDLVVSGCVDY